MSRYYEQLLSGYNRRNTIFLTPKDFLQAAADYFKWCEEYPIEEEQVNVWQGNVIRTDIPKVRPFTKQGLATYLGIPYSRLNSYISKGGEWEDTVKLIEQVIYTQKFENAAVGLLKEGIIIRELGLAEKQEVSGPDGGPIETSEVPPRERIASRLARLSTATDPRENSSESDRPGTAGT